MKKIFLFFLTAAVVFLGGCSESNQNNTQNSSIDNIDSVEPYTDTYSESTTIDKSNTNAWPSFLIKELGFSIKFPFTPGQVHRFDEFFYTPVVCDKMSCGDKQYAIIGDFKEKYKALGSVSKDYLIGSSWQIHELYDVTINKDSITIFGPQKRNIDAKIMTKIKNDAGTMQIAIVPVKTPDDLNAPEAFTGEDGYAAFFKLADQNKKYKAAVFYFKTSDLSLDAFEKALKSMVLEK